MTAKFEPFLRSYYDTFKHKSIDSLQFKDFFLEHFKEAEEVGPIDWDTWLNLPGMPKYQVSYDQSLSKVRNELFFQEENCNNVRVFQVCTALKEKWLSWNAERPQDFPKSEFDDLSTAQKVEFLRLLLEEEPLGHRRLEAMASAYGLNEIRNISIRFRWIRLGLRGRWQDAVPRAVQLVTEQGRLAFLRPIYR